MGISAITATTSYAAATTIASLGQSVPAPTSDTVDNTATAGLADAANAGAVPSPANTSAAPTTSTITGGVVNKLV